MTARRSTAQARPARPAPAWPLLLLVTAPPAAAAPRHRPAAKVAPPATVRATVYRRTRSGMGVEVSSDGGKTWRDALPDVRVREIAIGGGDHTSAYLVGDGSCGGARRASYATHDGGRSWRAIGDDLVSIAVSPRDPLLLFAAACDGLRRSRDGGRSFAPLAGTQVDGATPALIAVAPRAPDTIYTIYVTRAGAALPRRSTDGGDSFTACGDHDGDMQQPVGLAVEPTDAAVVHLWTADSSYLSMDGCATWHEEAE